MVKPTDYNSTPFSPPLRVASDYPLTAQLSSDCCERIWKNNCFSVDLTLAEVRRVGLCHWFYFLLIHIASTFELDFGCIKRTSSGFVLGGGNWNGTAASTTKLPLMRAASGSAAFAESYGGNIGIRLLDRWLPMEHIKPPLTHLRSFLSLTLSFL